METSDIKQQFNSSANRVAEKANTAVDRARRAGEEFLDTPLAERVQEGISALRTRSMDAYDTSVAAVRRNPAAWLGAALGVGIIAGLIFGRRRT
jgi:ElaB/YqjD/DUF883 family membrane-anchored ribosome-binding protein